MTNTNQQEQLYSRQDVINAWNSAYGGDSHLSGEDYVDDLLPNPPLEDGKLGGEVEDEFIQKHLVKIMELTADSMIKSKLERMYGGLEMSSVEYFVKTGTVNGSFRQRIKELLVDFASKWHTTAAKSQPSTPVPKQPL